MKQLEAVIDRGLKTFWEVGEALFTIRDERLYRDTHKTFEEYCKERWSMSRVQAHRLITAADVTKDLLPIGNTPVNESVARPLATLNTEQRQEAYKLAIDLSPDSKPTAAIVTQAVATGLKQKCDSL